MYEDSTEEVPFCKFLQQGDIQTLAVLLIDRSVEQTKLSLCAG